MSWSQWPRGLRRRSTAARLLKSWVRIPPGAWMSVCCEYWVLLGRGLCDELITRPEEPYRLWCAVLCDLEKQTTWMRRPRPTRGLSRQEKKSILSWRWLNKTKTYVVRIRLCWRCIITTCLSKEVRVTKYRIADALSEIRFIDLPNTMLECQY